MLKFHKCQTSRLLSLQAREKYCTVLKNFVTLGRSESVYKAIIEVTSVSPVIKTG